MQCNLRQIRDYPNVYNYLKELFQIPAFGSVVDFDHIKKSYYYSMNNLNPSRVCSLLHFPWHSSPGHFYSIFFLQIVPLGPEIDLKSTHNRDSVGKK